MYNDLISGSPHYEEDGLWTAVIPAIKKAIKKGNATANLFSNLLPIVLDSLIGNAMLIRELAFEDVRASKFPSHPSRQKCAWLIAPDKGQASYWLNELEGGRVFRVLATGKIHRGHCGWLLDDVLSFRTYQQRAYYYWLGLPCDDDDDAAKQVEIILEGHIYVDEEIKMGDANEE